MRSGRPNSSTNGAAVSSRRVAERGDDDWVRELGSEDVDTAQRDLRQLLVVRLQPVLARRGVSADLCEDFAQEALLRIRERLSDFCGQGRFIAWALSIAMRIAFDELRHKRWKDVSFEAVSADAATPLSFEPGADAPQEKRILRERVLEQLRQVIDCQLTEKQRRVLVAELQGMPHAEIAAQLGMKRNALYKLSHDARRRVKVRLEAAGFIDAEVRWAFE